MGKFILKLKPSSLFVLQASESNVLYTCKGTCVRVSNGCASSLSSEHSLQSLKRSSKSFVC